MEYAGVVVLYNPDDRVIQNIKSYIDEVDKLYLIDNSSADHRLQFSFDHKIEYIPFFDNKGIATALNEGAKRALEEGASWLLTMDQDSQFISGSLQYMKQYIIRNHDKRLGIVSPFHNTVRADGNLPIEDMDAIIVMTSGNLVNLEAYQDIKGFKDWLFIDCVDFDFCLHLKRKHYDIITLHNAILEHELGETIKKQFLGKTLFIDNHNHIRRYYIVRNRHYLYDEYVNDFEDYCKAEIKCTRKEVIKILLFEKHKIKKLWYMYKGFRDYQKRKVGRLDG